MFNRKENISPEQRYETSGRLASTLIALSFCLAALLVPSSVFATDPMDLDPDPDATAPLVTIVVSDLEDANVQSLAPGHYLIIVISEDGSTQTYEIWI